jgi:hypothetical protein
MKLFTLALVATGLAALMYKKRNTENNFGTQSAGSVDSSASRNRPWAGSDSGNGAYRQRSEADGRPASTAPSTTPASNVLRGDLP